VARVRRSSRDRAALRRVGDQALAIFIIGGLAFYLLPLILIGILLVAIVVAAAILQYF